MARLVEQLRDWLSRVEMVAHGAERRRSEAVRALENGRPWLARSEALLILSELPHSPLALALWADAAEATFLDHEAVEALERLAAVVPFRADVWYRLALARERIGQSSLDYLERAASAAEPVEAADAARLLLAERDLRAADLARSERWLEQLSLGARRSPEALALRTWLCLATDDFARARSLQKELPEPAPLDAKGWLLAGSLAALDDPAAAVRLFKRALLLDPVLAAPTVQEWLSRSKHAGLADGLRELVRELGLEREPAWRAAFAANRGDTDGALEAFAESAAAGRPRAVDAYLRLAFEAHSAAHLRRAVELAGAAAAPEIAALAGALSVADVREQLRSLDAAPGSAWAAELRVAALGRWLPEQARGAWPELLPELVRAAFALGDTRDLHELELVAQGVEGPLRVAILGEFNVGKSSFINAVLGEPVAPTGIVPTTATLNRVVYAPDRFARVELSEHGRARDRIVAHAALAETLAAYDPDEIEQVTIYAPLELLLRIELVDTPGFNAPDARHAARARRALDEAHAAIWLFDATQPFKESERAVLLELKARELPLFVLVNKLDRLPAGDAEAERAALTHVERGLGDSGVEIEAAPLAFSARLLRGGAEGAALEQARARWAEVQARVLNVLESSREMLRERALRRRARSIALRLARSARARFDARQEVGRASGDAAAQAGEAANRGRRQRAELERALDAALVAALSELERVLLPTRGYETEAAVQRFIAERTRELAVGALTRAVLDWVGSETVAPERRVELEGAVSVAAEALAPWLRGGIAWRPGSGLEPSAQAALARRRLIELATEQALRVLDRAAAPVPEALPSVEEARAFALARALGGAV